MMSFPVRVTPHAGQESVWDYPRPPRLEPVTRHIEVWFNSEIIVDSHRASRVLETSHPPVFYIPPDDVRLDLLRPGSGSSFCEWKGVAVYYDIQIGSRRAANTAWSYPRPTPAFAPIAGYLAFYPGLMDECRVDGIRAEPQPGSFYGGWVTPDIAGPFKGEPGSQAW